MAPAKGNTHAKKLSTPKIKADAYKQYCAHISKGWSKNSFVFKHPTISITAETMEKYIKNEPNVFDIIHKNIAQCKSLQHWEELGKSMMVGEIKGAQPAIYQMFMRNKFGWDKEEKTIQEAPKEFDSTLDIIKPPVAN